jgi:hypothetical protein
MERVLPVEKHKFSKYVYSTETDIYTRVYQWYSYGNIVLYSCDEPLTRLFFAYFPYFEEKIKVGLWDHLPVCVSVSLLSAPKLLNAWTDLYETWYVHIMESEPINGVLHESLPSVCVSVCVSFLSLLGNGSVNTFPRKRIHTTIKELLVPPFSMQFASYQRPVCGSVCVSPYHC